MNRTVPGLLKVLLCALLLGVASLPVWAICRPENRVGGFPVFSSVLASQETAKPIEPQQENPGCGYDFVSGMHKYLYCQGNPVIGIDPSGHDLIDVMCSLYVRANMMSMSMQTTVMAYSGPAAFAAILSLSSQSYSDQMNSGNYAVAGVMAGIDLFSFGEGGQILRYPACANTTQLEKWVISLVAQHPASSDKGMAAALQFAEQITELNVFPSGVKGADIVGKAMVNGTTQTLKREVSAFKGDLSKNPKNFYDKIFDEAAQTKDAQIRQVFIQITDDVKSVSNWQQIIRDKVVSAKSDLGNVLIYVVDGNGRSVL